MMEQDINVLRDLLGWHGYVMENYGSYEAIEGEAEESEGLHDWGWWSEMGGCQTIQVPGIGEVYYHGAFEYIGNQHALAFQIDGQDYVTEGEWVSHDGMYWTDELHKARARQITTTLWESVA